MAARHHTVRGIFRWYLESTAYSSFRIRNQSSNLDRLLDMVDPAVDGRLDLETLLDVGSSVFKRIVDVLTFLF